ncbi:hypothetical protein TraAM80_03891 [Trypanosoma rangeli]|uniref:Uncharacterized protein n=1 Tax=Trypanosoma rangeli TaxID=5698 RepID=A0A3R7KH65_TRYRA|nr:uncharacterized protein TraAM80_03891 [Trypanosoma rangeli]RNF06424.1 hypothetical protein TraAM80_03891 [Trypanosoma rangeli]|eukprot:RNF06424.1 hypothetical protein TraAM80_03891 [Trypanosoma rangeli]
MSDHVVYGKPLMVTEEKLREARVKQMKQKALRDALDGQVAQGKRHMLNNDVFDTRNNAVKRDAVQKQYMFSCEDGCGKFIQVSDSCELREHPAQTVLSTSTAGNAHNNNAAMWNVVPGHSKPLDFISDNQPLYQSNSLPPNFSMNTSEANPLAPKRTEYNSNSLPLDFVCSSKKQNGGFNKVSPRARESLPRGVSPKHSPRSVKMVKEQNYTTNYLPCNFSSEDVKKLLHELKTSTHTSPPPPQSPVASPGIRRRHANVAPPLHSRPNPHQKQHVGYLPPLDVADGLVGRRTSGEPPPPLELFGSPPREVLGAQAQNGKSLGHPRLKQLSAPRGPSNDARGRPSAGIVEPRNGHKRAIENTVEQLQKKLESRDFQMAIMREKEKNWEEQVKQLKMELKSAKKKQRDLNKLVKEGPIRAETAPDQPFIRTPKQGFHGAPLRKGLGAPSAPGLGGKEKFVKGCIFTKEMFCPISVPSDNVSTSFVPQQQNRVPFMQDSFKCASALTRKTAFGLAEENANRPVPIEYEHLLQFVKEHIITQQQADELWRLFSNENSPLTLIRQQASNVNLPGEVETTSMDSNFVLENEMEEFSYDDDDTEQKKIEVEEEDGTEAHDDVGEEVVYSNGYDNEEIETEYDTFETFAELHQEEYLSEEEMDDE